ncbi:hypothetical protein [Mesobacillus subterraneus]|uniref:Uncharacterized protein n=1 Tax=Mesobacillus subterraneus TaxID=285983 RepID=A0A3R9DUD9_9BACI|nr:hypothetical protein EJA10_09190 [Mesobacillus subterraneus]
MHRRRPYYGGRRPFGFGYGFGGPFIGGVLGGLLGSALLYPQQPYPLYTPYGYPPYGGPYGYY